MIRKLIVAGGGAEREVVLTGTVVVGRDPACTVSDLDPLLSRRHAEFVVNEDRAIIRDLKSRNGILVNGVKLIEHVLEPGDTVQLGHLHVRYVEEEPPVIEHDPRAHATTATGMAPTVAVLGANAQARQAAAPPAESPHASAPDDDEATRWSAATETHRIPEEDGTSDEPAPADSTDLDVTTMPAARPTPEPAPAPPQRQYSPDDFDSTRLAASRYEAEITRAAAASRPARPEIDLDATMLTAAPLQTGPRAASAPAPQAVAERPTEGWVVADASLTITEASPMCAELLGVHSESLVGASLGETLAQALGHVSAGDGPSPLSLSIERGRSTGALTITFTAGKASGISS